MEAYLSELAHAFTSQGHGVRVGTRFTRERPPSMEAVHRSAEPARQYEEGGVTVDVLAPTLAAWLRPVHRLHFRPAALPIASTLMWRAFGEPLLRGFSTCDVLHYSGTGQEMLGYAVVRLARRLECPFVITPHTHANMWGEGEIDFALYKQADRVIALTEDERERLEQGGVPEARLRVLGHGVNVRGGGDATRFRARHGLKGPIVLFLGRKTEQKGYDLLLEAARHLHRRRPDVHVVLAGPPGADGDGRPRERGRRIHDLGVLSDEEREDAYAACDVFCVPSAAEAYGLVYLEAWAYGKPVVALEIPTLRELIGSTGGGLLTERDPAAVADAIRTLVADDALRERLGRTGRSVARGRTWASVAADLARIYAECV